MPAPAQDPIQALLDQYKTAYGFQTNGIGGPAPAAKPTPAPKPKPTPQPIAPKPAAPPPAQNPAFAGTNIDPGLVEQLLKNPQILQLLTGQVPPSIK